MAFLVQHCCRSLATRFALGARQFASVGNTATTTTESSSTTAPSSGPNFQLSDEQQQMRDVARHFARNEMLPAAAGLDRSGEYPWQLIRQAWELGLLNVHVPKAYGGLELDCLSGCAIVEELSYACVGIQVAMKVSEIGVTKQQSDKTDQLTEQLVNPHSKCPLF